jgi:hypothetical protein
MQPKESVVLWKAAKNAKGAVADRQGAGPLAVHLDAGANRYKGEELIRRPRR